MPETNPVFDSKDRYAEEYGFHETENYTFKARRGLDADIVREISRHKGEPQWMTDFRLRALKVFEQKPMPTWGGDLSAIDFANIYYYIKPAAQSSQSWEDVPAEMKSTFNKLGVPEAEQKFLAGLGAQYECLAGDTRVYTTRGAVPIRDIQAGDTVFSYAEDQRILLPCPVKATAAKGQRTVWAVKVGTHTLRATANHPFLTLVYERPEGRRQGQYRRAWRYLHELRPGDLVAVAKAFPDTGAPHPLSMPTVRTTVVKQGATAAQTVDISYRFNEVSLPAQTTEDLMWPLADQTDAYLGFAKIEAMTPAGAEAVYDIEVDGPHNFVAEGLIVHNSEMLYHSLHKDLEAKGIIFLSADDGLRQHPDLFKQYFGTLIPPTDNKFAALNSAVWSGGSFIYIPKGVKVEMPLQAYFRINAQNMGQFERTLIVVDEDAYLHYVEGCFLAGARVRTRQGEKPIEQIEKGDEVLTHRGRYRKVYRTLERPYRGMLYHLRYFGDSSQTLHVTAEHPLLVVPRERAHNRNQTFNPQWLTAADLKPGDYLAIPVPQPETVPAAAQVTQVAVGRGRHASVQREVALPLEPDFFKLSGYYYTDTREFGATVYTKHVPEFVRIAPPAQLREWVRGLWRGAGSYDARKNMFRFNTVSRDLAYAFRDAVLRLGIAASINCQKRETPRQLIYAVIIASPWNPQFGEVVGQPAPAGSASGSPFYLDGQYLYAPIRSIEIEPVNVPVYNFSVAEDESYIAGGVVSHNCTAPIYSSDSLHAAVVEIIIKRGGRCRYTTLQNWSTNVYNLVTKRAAAYADATMEWVDGNLGCLAEGSTVTTPKGLKRIEDLGVGEQVLSLDETTGQLCFRAVTAKRFSGYQPTLTVTYGARQLRVTANHPFYSYTYLPNNARQSDRYQLGYVRADHLTEAIVPRHSFDFGQPYQSRQPVLETALASRSQYQAAQASTLAPVYTPDNLTWRLAYTHLQLPETLEVVPVVISPLSAEKVPTWDIEVEGTGNFVSEGFIVHNSKLTMKYPAVYLMEPGAHGEVLSIAFAGPGQQLDAGAKIIHVAPHTSSKITSKSISKGGGRSSYRGLLKVHKGAVGARANVVCDALLLDPQSRSDTYPTLEVDENQVSVGHEASVSKVSEDQLFYLMSRGLSEEQAASMVVGGFIEPLVKELPMEYAVELNRLVQLQMEGSVG